MLFTTLRSLCGLVLAATVAVALVACGSGGEDDAQFSSEVVPQQVAVSADPGGALRWDKAEYSAQAGDVTFVVKNPSSLTHQFGVEGNGVSYQSPYIKGGATGNYTIKGLKPGRYQLVCNYSGHKHAGMAATLVVE